SRRVAIGHIAPDPRPSRSRSRAPAPPGALHVLCPRRRARAGPVRRGPEAGSRDCRAARPVERPLFESLVIVTREAVEAALVVAIALAYLERSGGRRFVPWVSGGVAAAVACSILGVILIPNFAVHSEKIEGWALLAGGICVVSLVLWMRHAGKSVRREIES